MPKGAIYDLASMEAAIQELQSNPEPSVRAVAKKYGIPRTSLQFKLKNPGNKETFGPLPVVSHDEEKTLVRWRCWKSLAY
jgi:hypothetical protein